MSCCSWFQLQFLGTIESVAAQAAQVRAERISCACGSGWPGARQARQHAQHDAIATCAVEVEDLELLALQPARQVGSQAPLRAVQARLDSGAVEVEAGGGLVDAQLLDHA